MRGKILAAGLLCGVVFCTGCSGADKSDSEESTKRESTTKQEETTVEEKKELTGTVQIDETTTYQTLESFGASGAWWSQDVGGWTDLTENGEEKREYIAKLLFDPQEGIGLTCYRYNIGAGSTDGKSDITDKWRQAESFLNEAGEYDWSKDAGAVWFLQKAVSYGVEDINFFVNSPLVTLTKNGKAHGDEGASVKSNLAAENYEAFEKYVLDVTEHFVNEGIPVRYLSPINEPQWDWTGGQEGCHYEPSEMVSVLDGFIEKIAERESLSDVTIAAPECGEWGNTSYSYYEAIKADETLSNYLDTWDVHSYWSDQTAKKGFVNWLGRNDLNPVLKTSEWCEMTNGKDITMDSALHLSTEIADDLTILNVTSWQYWIAVSCYNYRDGLIYVYTYDHTISIPKRFWAMGNYSRFIRPGFVRVDMSMDTENVTSVAFKGTGADGSAELVLVLTNENADTCTVKLPEFTTYSDMEVYVTDQKHNLENTANGAMTEVLSSANEISLSEKSVTTLVFK